MKKLLLIALLVVGWVFADQYEDVVILKDGSEIHGIIIEEKPYEYIKIQSGKNTFVFQFDEIELLIKELILSNDSDNKSDITDKTWSFGLGFLTNRGGNIVAFSKDIRIGNNSSLSISSGWGLSFIGIGLSTQRNYNEEGLYLSVHTGFMPNNLSFIGNYSYQWRMNKQGFFSLGLSGSFLSDKQNDNSPFIAPVISYDYRF